MPRNPKPTIHPCSIPVGTPGSRFGLYKAAKAICADYIEPRRFACRNCRQEWTHSDVSNPNDVDTACCSNCYGVDVMVISFEAFRVVEMSAGPLGEIEERMNGGMGI